MDLEKYRRKDGTICLESAFVDFCPEAKNYTDGSNPLASKAIIYLYDIECIQPINSRQATAIALANAKNILEG